MRKLRDKKALITGAASGIGRAISLAIAAEGTHLYLLDIDEEKLAGTADLCRASGVNVITRRCDLAVSEEISAAMAALQKQWGGVDIVINNAGVAYWGKLQEMPAGQWERILAINLYAPVKIVEALLPSLLDRSEKHTF